MFKAIGIVVVVMVLLIWTGAITLGVSAVEEAGDVKGEFESYIGEPFVLNGDTSVIVDYSVLNGVFVLSNGTKVHKKLVMQQGKQQ